MGIKLVYAWTIFSPQQARNFMHGYALLCVDSRTPSFNCKEKVTGEVTHTAEKAVQHVS